MENAHERHWPQGLATLGKNARRRKNENLDFFSFREETRQINRRHYESYVCRRLVGKQAVIVLGCDNRHMDQLMGSFSDFVLILKNDFVLVSVTEPGIVMIFAHGVE